MLCSVSCVIGFNVICYAVVWCVAGLNLMSQFNLDNVTVYCTKPEELDPTALKSVSVFACIKLLFLLYLLLAALV